MKPPFLIHFDPAKPILVLTDAPKVETAGILIMQPKNVESQTGTRRGELGE